MADDQVPPPRRNQLAKMIVDLAAGAATEEKAGVIDGFFDVADIVTVVEDCGVRQAIQEKAT
jgi:hypothetical protein